MIKEIYKKKEDKELELDIENLSTPQDKQALHEVLRAIGCEELDIGRHIPKNQMKANLSTFLSRQTKCLIRVYIIEG